MTTFKVQTTISKSGVREGDPHVRLYCGEIIITAIKLGEEKKKRLRFEFQLIVGRDRQAFYLKVWVGDKLILEDDSEKDDSLFPEEEIYVKGFVLAQICDCAEVLSIKKETVGTVKCTYTELCPEAESALLNFCEKK